MITPKGSHAIAGREDVLACFDATAANTFRWICRLVGSDGDRADDRADDLLADVYLSLRRATADGTVTEVDDDWLLSTAFHLADHQDRTRGLLHDALSVRDRALLDLDLDLGQQHGTHRDRETTARIVGIAADDVVAALADAERAAGATTTDAVADMLRRSERWLDDTTRRRVRSAVVRGERTQTDSRPAGSSQPNRPLELISTSSAGERPAPAPSGPGADLGRPRRLMIGVAAGIAVLLAVGLIWITPDDSVERGDDPAAVDADPNTPVSSDDTTGVTDASDTTSPPATAEAEPIVTSGSRVDPDLTLLSPGFILGEPVGDFEPVSLWENPVSAWQDQPEDSWRQVWSEPGASRTTGRWFAISIGPGNSFPYVRPTAASARILVDGHLGVTSTERDGVTSIDFALGPEAEGPTVNLIGHGLAIDELQLLAGALAWDDTASPVEITEIEFEPSADVVLQRMTLVESKPTFCCGVRSYRPEGDQRTVQYRSGPPDQTGGYLAVSTLDGRTSELDSRFFEPSSPDPAAPTNTRRTVEIGDRTVFVSGEVYSDGTTDFVYNSARWFEGSQTIVVAGTVDLATLSDAVTAARPARITEWRDLAAIQPELQDSPNYPFPRYLPVGDVQFADGTTWSLRMSIDPGRVELSYEESGGMSGPFIEQPFVEDPLRPVHELVTAQATVLVITLRDQPAGTGVRVTVAGRDPVVVPLVAVGDSGLLAAFDAFRELPPYTVELVDAAGATLQLLNP